VAQEAKNRVLVLEFIKDLRFSGTQSNRCGLFAYHIAIIIARLKSLWDESGSCKTVSAPIIRYGRFLLAGRRNHRPSRFLSWLTASLACSDKGSCKPAANACSRVFLLSNSWLVFNSAIPR